MGYILDNDIQFLSGVGERRARLLRSELGIRTLGDLLYHFPFRYIDRSRIWRIGELRDDSLTYVQLQVRITDFRAIADSTVFTEGCCKKLTHDEIYDILCECK